MSSIGMSGVPDPKLREAVENLVALTRASGSWYWRSLAIIVTIAAVVSAIFQTLSYFCR